MAPGRGGRRGWCFERAREEARGTTLLPETEVTAVEIVGGKVMGVQTSRGSLRASVAVDAAGAWMRQVAEPSAICIPLVPPRRQLIITEPLEGLRVPRQSSR